MEDKIKDAIKTLTDKAKESGKAIDSQQLSQSVLNLTNSLGILNNIPNRE